jgi:hypothetical protein
MTKRPKEVRLPKKPSDTTCFGCECSGEFKIEEGWICHECFHLYCEVCKQFVDAITVRRDPTNQHHTHKQACCDCYLQSCHDIIKLDSEYGIEDIDKKKDGLCK